jgi:pSer/pThr/pTyr-binding forkhead associated (FHA) protein
MWILSSEGDFFKGKSIWLRPGKKYLFGRVNTEGSPPRNYGVDHKSISRKHLVISVAPVKPGDGLHLHTRSEVTIEDQGSKLGTKLDGQKIQAATRVLDGESHVIRVGNYEHVLKYGDLLLLGSYANSVRVKWFPVVITYSLSSKEGKGKDPLSAPRGRLEDLDIKTIDVYATEFTTHVVATKRNTPKGLEALINGKYIVTDSYIDAVVYAATPEVLDSAESLSPLEQDFDRAWPDPLKHLPAPGKEPTSRPPAAYAPDKGRTTVFEFYTFVFSDKNQYDNLSSAINSGHGKALLFEVTPGRTKIDEFMQYVRTVANDKGLDGFSNPDGPGGIVVVTYLPKGHETWANALYQEVAIQMDQRCAVQNEFLEAILAKDPSSMKRALEGVASTPASRAPPCKLYLTYSPGIWLT